MPGNLDPALPTLVMPMTLCSAFSEIIFLDANIDEYADGSSTRKTLAFNGRRGFKMARPLLDYQLDDLRGFYRDYARYGHPFWFYNLPETEPPFTWDATGQNPVGRYTCVWEGGWTENLALGRHSAEITLREVA